MKTALKTLTLITGGIKSGKSRYALELARQSLAVNDKYFVASAEPLDEEMKARIANHQAERSSEFLTIEEPLHLAAALNQIPQECGLVVVDCLTLWVNNLLFHFADKPNQIEHEVAAFITTVSSKKSDMIFVTNEVGLGLIPDNPLSRRYVDQLGSLNQKMAKLCDEVVFMVSGIPNRIKGEVYARLDQ